MRDKRKISLNRARELRDYNSPYEEAREQIPSGGRADSIAQYEESKKRLLEILGAGPADWESWKWQMKNRIDDVDILKKAISLTDEETEQIRKVSRIYRWAVTPYYLALMDPGDPRDPIRLQSVPSFYELDSAGENDPMCEEFTNPAGNITRRYPDRLILNVTNSCAMFCRHCQRRRRIGETDRKSDMSIMDESIAYIKRNPEIRDVLITGGDPMTLSNKGLEYILSGLRAIPHVEIIRIGTRALVTMPQRFDDEFVEMAKKYHPVYINTHFNHPREVTPQTMAATEKLCSAGIPLGNQMVLLEGINNDRYVVRLLNHELLKARIRPYYIFHAKMVKGTLHFGTSIDDGLDIIDHLRGWTSGMAIPTYILNAPGGLGKIPLLPEYVVDRTDDKVTLRTWEGKLVEYPNKRPQKTT